MLCLIGGTPKKNYLLTIDFIVKMLNKLEICIF